MPPPAFATPLPQSCRSETLEWRFPKPFHNYVLTGKSRAAWHTSFVIPQLNLLLDAGLCVNKLRPKHIFLTHGHSDHALLAPAFVTGDDPPDVFCPVEMVGLFDDFVLAKRLLNQGGISSADGTDAEDLEDDREEKEDGAEKATNNQDSTEPVKNGGLRISHITHGLRHGDVVPLRRTKNITATAFKCDHTIPCLGYVFSTTTLKLRPEYASLPGPELKALRQSGVDITAAITTPIFAFLGDTTAATLAAGPEWLRQGIPVVITECSFLREEHRAQATKTKHTFWPELEQVVRQWPRTTFILTHFSMRYSDEEIRKFFKELPDPPGNIVVWVDGEGAD
ncbi:beta-lactamase-like protein [Podospora appendiculata]|uniref:Beta-lactamase-like protein n=1 Tax=Podospora appendiculata TaxID=314037 RepID=A0AAE0XF71_9PEZI|nr:beta-lactamase-like protein [Podospora appendiculata]